MFGGDSGEVNSGMVGVSVTLQTNPTEVQRDKILWLFGPRIAEIYAHILNTNYMIINPFTFLK